MVLTFADELGSVNSMWTRMVFGAFILTFAATLVASCGVTENAIGICDPEALFPHGACLDAGTDGDADPDAQGTCPGVCVRGPSDDWGALWRPGTCLASIGDPIGEAHPNADTAVTFCCIPPFAG